jgi:hypothetical protein
MPFRDEEKKVFFMNATRLHCHFSIMDRKEENIHSVIWYWTPTGTNAIKLFADPIVL